MIRYNIRKLPSIERVEPTLSTIDEYAMESDKIYSLFIEYLKNPSLKKVKDESIGQKKFSIYVLKVFCMLSQTSMYIIAFILADNEKEGTIKRLRDLPWVSLQFRNLSHIYNDVPILKHEFPSCKDLQDLKINRIKITDEASIYDIPNLPLTVTLLHTQKKTRYDYQDKGNLLAAIVTWETVINFS